MQDINTLVTQNFNENITYLQQYHPEVFNNISALESAIENGHYKEKYELVYENENFDVSEKNSNKFLYDKQSKNYAQLAAQSVNKNIDNNVFETFHKRVITKDDLQLIKSKEPFMDHLSGFSPILHYIQEHTKPEQKQLLINKFIFFGTGLGLHINTITEKISPKFYLIIEDDLELFRLSLFTTNYSNLAKKAQLTFSIFQNKESFSITATKFLTDNYEYNHYIKYFHMLSHTQEKQTQMHQLITSQPHLTFFYHTMLKHYTRPLTYLLNDYKFLNKTATLNSKHLRDKPFLFLAAGPSLEKNSLWLQENHQYFIIVAVAATLPSLEKVNISPDIIIQLDGHLNSVLHFQKLQSLEFIKNSIYFFSDKVPLSIVNMLPKEQLFFFENATHYKKNSLRPTAFCVGSVGFELLLLLQVKDIYLLGLDLALDQDTGQTHSNSHVKATSIDLKETSQNDDVLNYHTILVKVQGNHADTILTTQHFNESIDMINYFIKHIKKAQQRVTNLSDGAMFKDTMAKTCNDVHFTEKLSTPLQKEQIISNIQKASIKNASSGLTSLELKSLQNKLSYANNLKEILLNHLALDISSKNEYLKELQKISAVILKEESLKEYELNRILEAYIRYIVPYLYDFVAQEATMQQDMMCVRKLFLEHIVKIIDFYCEALSEG